MSLKAVDFAKATGIAVTLLVINVLIAVLVIFIYRFVITPGQTSQFYDSAVLRIAPWCSHIAGTALFFGAGYLFTRRRPTRNAFLFAVIFTIMYALVDAATVGFVGTFSAEFGLSMLAKLLAAQAGVLLATRTAQQSASTGDS